jgi:hypothetical protein
LSAFRTFRSFYPERLFVHPGLQYPGGVLANYDKVGKHREFHSQGSMKRLLLLLTDEPVAGIG